MVDDLATADGGPAPGPLRGRCPATVNEVRLLRRMTNEWARAGGLAGVTREDLVLAVSEACENIVEHAYRDGLAGELEYDIASDRDGVRVRIRDFGSWRPPPTDPGFRGRGLWMIRQLSERFSLVPDGGGTILEFIVAAGLTEPDSPSDPRGGSTPSTPGRSTASSG